MRAIRSGLPRGACVYAIRCLADGRVYVGSSETAHRRWLRHRRELLDSRHKNVALAAAWNEHGEAGFVVEVLEAPPLAELRAVEERWIAKLQSTDPAFGFNQYADGRTPGHFTISAEVVQARRAKLLKTYDGFIDPDGNLAPPIADLKAFCAARGLHSGSMALLSDPASHLRFHQGWTHVCKRRSVDPPPPRARVWCGFVNPQGEEVTIFNLAAFCRERGLSRRVMEMMAKGPDFKQRVRSHRGWTHRSWHD